MVLLDSYPVNSLNKSHNFLGSMTIKRILRFAQSIIYVLSFFNINRLINFYTITLYLIF